MKNELPGPRGIARTTENDGRAFEHFGEVRLRVDITDLLAVRKKELIELSKGKDRENPSVADQITENKVCEKYEKLIRERSQNHLNKQSLGLCKWWMHSTKSVSALCEMVERNLEALNFSEKERAYRYAKRFLEQCLKSKEEALKINAIALLDELEILRKEYTEQEKREQINKVNSPKAKGDQNKVEQAEPPPSFEELTTVIKDALGKLGLLNSSGNFIGQSGDVKVLYEALTKQSYIKGRERSVGESFAKSFKGNYGGKITGRTLRNPLTAKQQETLPEFIAAIPPKPS